MNAPNAFEELAKLLKTRTARVLFSTFAVLECVNYAALPAVLETLKARQQRPLAGQHSARNIMVAD